MAQTLTSMVKALSKKYPTKHINIKKEYLYYAHDKSFIKDYCLYIEDIACLQNVSFNQLLHEYKQLLNK